MAIQEGFSLFNLALLVLTNKIKFGSARGVAVVTGNLNKQLTTRDQSGSSGGEGRHEGIFIFAIVLLVVCIITIIVICARSWYVRRRREKQNARFAQFSWTEGVDILPENELHRVPSSIIKADISESREMREKEENESLLIDYKSS